MLEFAIVLPLMMFLLTLMVDVGRLFMVSYAMQDATYRSARASAVAGGAAARTPTGGEVYRDAFYQALDEIPGSDQVEGTPNPVVVTGQFCSTLAPNDQFVTVSSTYDVRLITPGLGTLLNLAGGNTSAFLSSTVSLTSASLSRCEVVGSFPTPPASSAAAGTSADEPSGG
jgi:Flp pilus assembly protein TadG